MIRFLTFLGFAFLCHITMAQNNSPYAIFGDHSKMLDATSCRQTSFSSNKQQPFRNNTNEYARMGKYRF